MNPETKIQNEAVLEVGLRDDVLIWRQHVGLFHPYKRPAITIEIGEPGMADLGAIVAVTITPEMVGRTVGIAVQPEVKTLAKDSKQRKSQEKWEAAVKMVGGIYALIRSPDDLVALIDRVQRGQW